MSFTSVGLLLLSPLLMMAVHALCLRSAWGRAQPRQQLTIQCAIGVAGALSLLLCNSLQSFVFSLTITLGLGHVYFHIFNMSETARRVRILIALVQGLSPTKVESTYSSEGVIQVRLQRLLSMNNIVESNGVYQVTPSLLLKISRAMKSFERLLFPTRV